MSNTIQKLPRLHMDAELTSGKEISLPREQAHYLSNVLRLGLGGGFRAFNGRNGEFLCHLTALSKRGATARCGERIASPEAPHDIDYLFAPLKAARLDYLAQKATEMGVRRLRPVITRHTVAERVNLARLRANTIEAAEQCNLVALPQVLEPQPLNRVLTEWDEARALVHCDEAAEIADPIAALSRVPTGPLGVLVGPEGGFATEERQVLASLPFVHSVRLGPRVMRADTAAVAVLALVQAVLGDWGNHQHR